MDYNSFTTAEAMRLGLSRTDLERAMRRGELVRPWRGFYRPPSPELLAHVRGLQRWLPTSVASHLTAAALYDIASPHGAVHLTVPSAVGLRSRSGLVLHRNTLAPDRVVEREGVQLTDAARTVVDCTRLLSHDDAVAIGDAALWARIVTLDQLRDELAALPRVRGVGRVEVPLRRCRFGAQSRQETVLRLCCINAGLPEPELQVPVLTQHGWCFADLGWPKFRVCAEYDGREPHSSADQFARDRRRWRGLEAAGWRVLPFSAQDLRNPAGVVAEIRAALADAVAAKTS